jgi:hypothetical protein
MNKLNIYLTINRYSNNRDKSKKFKIKDNASISKPKSILRKKSNEKLKEKANEIDFSKVPDIKDFSPVLQPPPPVPNPISAYDQHQQFISNYHYSNVYIN